MIAKLTINVPAIFDVGLMPSLHCVVKRYPKSSARLLRSMSPRLLRVTPVRSAVTKALGRMTRS